MSQILNEGGSTLVDVNTIKPHPENPRQGDLDAIKASITENGFYGALVVQRSTGFICAGNHRYLAARELGFAEVPVIYLDISDAKARKILAADNRTSDLGGYDEQGLVNLLESIREGDGLGGTGYDEDDLDDLIASLEGQDTGAMTDGMTPKERQADYEAAGVRSVVLPFNNENYDYVIKRLNELRLQLELSNNSDVLLYLVKDA